MGNLTCLPGVQFHHGNTSASLQGLLQVYPIKPCGRCLILSYLQDPVLKDIPILMGYPGKDEYARAAGRKGNIISDINIHATPHISQVQSVPNVLWKLQSVTTGRLQGYRGQSWVDILRMRNATCCSLKHCATSAACNRH